MLVTFFFDVRVMASRESGKAGDFQLSGKEKMIMNAVFIPMIISFVYAVFLPLQLEPAWLYSGLLVFLFGMAFTVVVLLSFATSPKDKAVTTGPYRFSRNPMYVGLILMQIGVGVACASWLYLLLTAVLMIMLNAVLSSEEHYCLYRFGLDYREYKDRTPRWIGTPKSKKSD